MNGDANEWKRRKFIKLFVWCVSIRDWTDFVSLPESFFYSQPLVFFCLAMPNWFTLWLSDIQRNPLKLCSFVNAILFEALAGFNWNPFVFLLDSLLRDSFSGSLHIFALTPYCVCRGRDTMLGKSKQNEKKTHIADAFGIRKISILIVDNDKKNAGMKTKAN